MPPTLALILTLGCIAFLFRRDIRQRPNVSGALWLPVLWMFLGASRPPTTWLGIFGLPGFGASSVEEGSPLEALIYFGLTLAAMYVLAKRRISLSEFIRDNPWLVIFLFYCFVAILWSDYPFVSFKRWIKILGHPAMVLIVLTEPDLKEALATLMKRCAYVLFPVSILWMKYYPNLGRSASEWGGMTNSGIAAGKNQLGGMCFVFGLFFWLHFLRIRQMQKSIPRRDELRLTIFLLWMIGYCLVKAHSATSDICFILGAAIIGLLGLRSVDKRMIGVYAIVAVIILGIGQLLFDIYGTIVGLTGHESTIVGRGYLWGILWQADTDPFFGAGFESFWLGERVEKLWAMPEFWWHPNEAHNGYLELYLNLGAVGLAIFLLVIFGAFRKVAVDLREDFEWGRFNIACLVSLLAHNWTEAGFRGLSFPFFVFFLIALRYSRFDYSNVHYADSVAQEQQVESPYPEEAIP